MHFQDEIHVCRSIQTSDEAMASGIVLFLYFVLAGSGRGGRASGPIYTTVQGATGMVFRGSRKVLISRQWFLGPALGMCLPGVMVRILLHTAGADSVRTHICAVYVGITE